MTSKQVNTTATFVSNLTNEIFDIYDSINYKSKYVIYLLRMVNLQNTICRKNQNAVSHKIKQSAYKYLHSPNHNFNNTHGKFSVIEQLRNITSSSTKILKERIKQRENLWIKKLKTLTPYGYSIKNSIKFIICSLSYNLILTLSAQGAKTHGVFNLSNVKC